MSWTYLKRCTQISLNWASVFLRVLIIKKIQSCSFKGLLGFLKDFSKGQDACLCICWQFECMLELRLGCSFHVYLWMEMWGKQWGFNTNTSVFTSYVLLWYKSSVWAVLAVLAGVLYVHDTINNNTYCYCFHKDLKILQLELFHLTSIFIICGYAPQQNPH